MEKLRKIAYAGGIVIPAVFLASGCGGDPPPKPAEVEDVTIEQLEEGATTGVELGTESESPLQPEGESEADSTESGAAEN